MTPTRATRRTPLSGMLRAVVLVGCIGSVVLAVIGWMAKGERAGYSALAGAGAAFGVILLGLLAMGLIMQGDPGGTMAGAFVVYLGQLVVLVAILLALRGQDWVDGAAFAASAIAQTVLLQVAQITGYARARHEVYPQGTVR